MPSNDRMVIANRLRDGLTVFLAADGSWVDSIDDGVVAGDDPAADALLARAEASAASNIVVAPYLIRVSGGDAGRRPVDWRESIRAFGPTVATGG